MNKIIILLTAFLSACPQVSAAQELVEWRPVRDGNMILTVRTIDKDGVHDTHYKHAIKTPSSKVPECAEARQVGEELWLLTQESKPSLYIVDINANAVQEKNETQWVAIE